MRRHSYYRIYIYCLRRRLLADNKYRRMWERIIMMVARHLPETVDLDS